MIAAAIPAASPTPADERPYVIRTYDRWIILVLVLVLGWLLFRPLFAFSVYYRGLSFERMFQIPTAEHYYIKSTHIYRNIPHGWLGWAELVMMKAPGDESQRLMAIRILQQGISYNPRSSQLEFDLGRMFYLGKQYPQARVAFLRSAQLTPTNMFSWDFAAWSALRAGDVPLALKYWREVLKLDPGNAVARRQIAHYGR